MPASTTILVSAGAQFGNSATAPSALVLLSTLLVCHTARVRPSSAPSPMCGVLTLPAIHGRNHAPLPKAHGTLQQTRRNGRRPNRDLRLMATGWSRYAPGNSGGEARHG